jgi:predicted permease
MSLRRSIQSLLALFRKRDLDQDLDGEVLAHLEMAERDALARGLSPQEARVAARREFGGIEQMKETHRDTRSVRWLENFFTDARYALAGLLRAPGFAAIIISVLGLGIGANVAMFSLVDAVFLKPLPFPNPERIVMIWQAPRPGVTNSTSTPDFVDWRRLGTNFEAMSAEAPVAGVLTGSGDPVSLQGKAVTPAFFQVFGLKPRLGRTFNPEEDQPGASAVVVLSFAAWQAHFEGAKDILNRRLILDGESHQVIGVLPPGAFDRERLDFFKPLLFTPEQLARRDSHWLGVFARLKPGVSVEQGRQQMKAIEAANHHLAPVFKRDWKVVVEQYENLLVGDQLRRSIYIAFGAVALVLLIACANVTNLLLAKGAARRKELAVRATLGASRGRLIAQLLTESLVLCLLGGIAGVAIASLLLSAAGPVLADSLPSTADVSIDYRVLAFAAAVAAAVALLVGILPSLRTSFGSLALSLNQSSRGSSGSHSTVRRIIVVAEVALSLVLVSGALLLFRSLYNLQQVETGIVVDKIMTMSLDLPTPSYPTTQSAALFYDSLADKLQAVPGVAKAGLTSHMPLRWIGNGEGFRVGGGGAAKMINVRFKRVDPGYFETLGIPIVAGRGITKRDGLNAPKVVVINEALAARMSEVAGIRNPIGESAEVTVPQYPRGAANFTPLQVVGVIRNERVTAPGQNNPPVVYVPMAQAPPTHMKLLVRTQADPASVMAGIRAAVREADSGLAIANVATMQEIRDRTLSGASRPAWVIGAFACVAALLAALGLYGVLSHAVAQQRREIGIRMALGARSKDVVIQILRHAFVTVAVGLALGMVGAFAMTRVMQSLLYQVSPLDPLALTAACAAMLIVGLAAGFVPANRAAHVDPVTTLRDEA